MPGRSPHSSPADRFAHLAAEAAALAARMATPTHDRREANARIEAGEWIINQMRAVLYG